MMATTSTLRCEVMLGKMLIKPGDVIWKQSQLSKNIKEKRVAAEWGGYGV